MDCSKAVFNRLVRIQIELPHDKTSKMAWVPSKDSDQPGHPPSPRLGWCLGWSESSLGTHVILLVLSWGGSIHLYHWDHYPRLYEPRDEKTCLRDFRPDKTRTGQLSYRDELESWNFGFSKCRYYTMQAANNKGADQTARMHRLICTFVVRIWHKQVFSWRCSYNKHCTRHRGRKPEMGMIVWKERWNFRWK